MQRFIALPTSGDAFFLHRDGVNILVDSGWKKDKLANLLNTHLPEIERIDIAICTHADGDHAGGFTTLLDQWQPRIGRNTAPIGQFWLPGAWTDVVPHLMLNAEELANKLVEEMKEFSLKHPNIDSIDEINSILQDESKVHDGPTSDQLLDEDIDLHDSTNPDFEKIKKFSEPEWMEKLRDSAKKILEKDEESYGSLQSAKRRVRYRIQKGQTNQTIGKYWLNLIDTANIIRQIAVSAIKHRVRIRWFDYSEFERTKQPRGGIRGLLVPINAVEQLRPPSAAIFSKVLHLSLVNEQCLSFYSPSKNGRSSVLFCGDSPMGTGKNYAIPFNLPREKAYSPIIVTAPHHGFKSNKIAYDHIYNWVHPWRVFWVRNGGSNRPPDAPYQKLPKQNQSCTGCPHSTLHRSPVEIIQYSNWYVTTLQIGHRCVC